MSEARERILAEIRGSLGRGRVAPDREAELRAPISARRDNPIPARATALDETGRIELFVSMAKEVEATVTRASSPEAVPEAVARYLAAENLPAELVMAPDPRLDAIHGIPGLCCGSAGAARRRKTASASHLVSSPSPRPGH